MSFSPLVSSVTVYHTFDSLDGLVSWDHSITGRESKPEERVFERIPSHLDIHHYRRLYARSLYRSLAGCDPPPLSPGERIKKGAYDLFAVRLVSQAPGHHRIDVVLTHYLN